MATFTTNAFLDDAPRTAGEVHTFNGGTLTVRTDTRWHANAPASMTGTFGGNSIISPTLGGGLVLDATNVRWMPYTGGGGTVPAIGTTVTRGGVSGYLLGVWATEVSAPTAVGAAMPVTGFLKFREVTGGQFTAGALTGITATAASPDVLGWIEVVADQAYNLNVPRLGKFQTRGGWFELGTTTGAVNQLVQVPTNGGGAGTECPGLWIEENTQVITNVTWAAGVATFTTAAPHGMLTKMGAVVENVVPAGYNGERKITRISDTQFSMQIESNPGAYVSGGALLQFEFYPALKTTAGFTTTNLGTDIRSRFVMNAGNGQMRIGSNGSNNIGYVPPAGKRMRVPNVFLRQCTTAARQTNAVPNATIATRPDFTTTNAGEIDCEYAYGDWYFLFSQPYRVKLHHVGLFDAVNISECATPLDLWDGITGMSGGTAGLDLRSLTLTSNFAGGEIVEWGGPRGNAPGSNDHDIEISFCIGQTFTHCRAGIVGFARNSGAAWYINQSSDIRLNYCRSTNSNVVVNTSFNISIVGHNHVDRYLGATNTTAGLYAVAFTNSCVGCIVDDLRFGLDGTIANCHPYNGCVSYSASTDIKVRNLGRRDAFLSGGSANFTQYIVADLGNNVDIKVQRCYMVPTRTGAHLMVNSTKNVLLEDVYGDFADVMSVASLNTLVRGGGGTNTTTGQASVYGSHFGGAFTSDTTGRMWLAMNEPTLETEQFTSKLFSPGSGFTSAGGLSLATVGDFFICEMQESRLQTTGFANIAPTITGTNAGNHSFEYQLDNGSGYSGVWKTLNAANLSAETVLPNVGYKLKFKIECTVANNANLISYVRCDTTSTLAAQVENLYPLDTNAVELTGLQPNTEVRAYSGTNPATAVEIAGSENISGTFSFSHAIGGQAGYIIIASLGFENIILPITYSASDVSFPIQQRVDRNFNNAP